MDAVSVAEILARPTVEAAARCRTTSTAAHLGRDPSERDAIRRVVAWLRYDEALADLWRGTDTGYLQRVAWWLIQLRDALEAREAYGRDARHERALVGDSDGAAARPRALARPAAAGLAGLARRPRPRGDRRLSLMQRLTVGVWIVSTVLRHLVVWVTQLAPLRGFRA